MSEHTMADMRELLVLRWGRSTGLQFDEILAAHDAETYKAALAELTSGDGYLTARATREYAEAHEDAIRADEREKAAQRLRALHDVYTPMGGIPHDECDESRHGALEQAEVSVRGCGETNG